MSLKDPRIEANREELAASIKANCTSDGALLAANGLHLYRFSELTQPHHGLYSPSICLVAQGAKEVTIGEQRLRYDPANFLLCSLDLPVVSQVVEASLEKPFLALKLELDPLTIASVSVEAGVPGGHSDHSVTSISVTKLGGDLLDAFVRLVRLLGNQQDFKMVSPLVTREIIYRLLMSEHGQRLRQIAAFGGHTHRITRAVHTLRNKFNEQLSIEDLARDLGMSASSFHQHFKTATSMSPLQFQKMLRLQEARRLLLTEDLDASSVASRVGYDDSSQFTREYKRLFGEPPMRDVSRFKKVAAAN